MTGAHTLAALAVLGILLGEKADAQTVPSYQAAPTAMKTAIVARLHAAPRPCYTLMRASAGNMNLDQSAWRLRTASPDNVIVPPAPWATFSSLSSPVLRSWVSRLPKGSSLLTFFRFGAVPSGMDLKTAMSLPPPIQWEVDDFGRFCRSVGVSYGYVTGAG